MLIELEVFRDVQLRRELLRFQGAVIDASPAFERMLTGNGRGFSLRKLEGRQFGTQGKTASGGWQKLAPSTVAEKARKGLDPKILHATGRLAASLTGGPGRIEVAAPHQMIFGTTVPYARLHQTGTRRMPRRRPIELREQDRREMVRILQKHLLGTMP